METVLYCQRQMTDFWPTPLVSHWRRLYPQLFDRDDERLARGRPSYHFKEWLAAIHLFHRDGTHALMSKYAYRNHPAKVERLEGLCSSSECSFLRVPGTHMASSRRTCCCTFPGNARSALPRSKARRSRCVRSSYAAT